jgi:hypothetical protein
MPARNEDWILGLSARAALLWCDDLVILDHASEDRTWDIVIGLQREFGDRVQPLLEGWPEWNEMEHRQRLLETARERGATHIALIDADEVLTGNLLPEIRGHVEQIPKHATLQLPWQCLRGSIAEVDRGEVWGVAQACVAFEDEPRCHWSSGERQGYQFHHRHPMGRPYMAFQPVPRSCGGLMHLQFVNERRLRSKQALYKMQEVVRWPGRQSAAEINAIYNPAVYGQMRATADHCLSPVPPEWWAPYASWMQYLQPDAAPWQEAECARLWEQHGEAPFAGLDLFGAVS